MDMDEPLTCTPVSLEQHLLAEANRNAIAENPRNAPHPLARDSIAHHPAFAGMAPPSAISVLTAKFWRGGGVRLTVAFLDNPEAALRARIVENMNAWSKTANVTFTETHDVAAARVRIARQSGRNGGYWSYVGTDILSIAPGEATMNLQGFTMATPDREFHRVVRHETGHTLGCPHEHMRRELIDLIDVPKAIEFFRLTQGWNEAMTRRQVLTPIEESSLLHTAHADQNSIMCYQLPGTITKSGKPILGGTDIDPSDFDFMGHVYPKPTVHGAHH